MDPEPKQNPDNYCLLRERVLRVHKISGAEVINLIFTNNEVAWDSWKYSENNVAAGKNVNVAVAAYVRAQAWLKLYEYLRKLGDSALYCDTD